MFYTIIRYLRDLYRRVHTILDSNRAEGQVPDRILADLARCFARDIPAFFAIQENQEAYKQWLQEREQQPDQAASEKDWSSNMPKTDDGGTV